MIKKIKMPKVGPTAPSKEQVAEKAGCTVSDISSMETWRQEDCWLVEVEVPDAKPKAVAKPKAAAKPKASKSKKSSEK